MQTVEVSITVRDESGRAIAASSVTANTPQGVIALDVAAALVKAISGIEENLVDGQLWSLPDEVVLCLEGAFKLIGVTVTKKNA